MLSHVPARPRAVSVYSRALTQLAQRGGSLRFCIMMPESVFWGRGCLSAEAEGPLSALSRSGQRLDWSAGVISCVHSVGWSQTDML